MNTPFINKILNSHPEFDGVDYESPRDKGRLMTQKKSILDYMINHAEKWVTLRQISKACQAPEASVSAQLRNFRKEKFGSHTVHRKHVKNGLFAYQLELNESVSGTV